MTCHGRGLRQAWRKRSRRLYQGLVSYPPLRTYCPQIGHSVWTACLSTREPHWVQEYCMTAPGGHITLKCASSAPSGYPTLFSCGARDSAHLAIICNRSKAMVLPVQRGIPVSALWTSISGNMSLLAFPLRLFYPQLCGGSDRHLGQSPPGCVAAPLACSLPYAIMLLHRRAEKRVGRSGGQSAGC